MIHTTLKIACHSCLFLLSLALPAQGIQFEHGTWAEALEKAKANVEKTERGLY